MGRVSGGVTAAGYVVSGIPAIAPADTPRGYAARVLQWRQDNDAHRDDNPTMTDDTNGTQNGDASPFGSLRINFGGADGTPAPAGANALNPFGADRDHHRRRGRGSGPAGGTRGLHGRPGPHRDARS